MLNALFQKGSRKWYQSAKNKSYENRKTRNPPPLIPLQAIYRLVEFLTNLAFQFFQYILTLIS